MWAVLCVSRNPRSNKHNSHSGVLFPRAKPEWDSAEVRWDQGGPGAGGSQRCQSSCPKAYSHVAEDVWAKLCGDRCSQNVHRRGWEGGLCRMSLYSFVKQ